MSLALAVLKKGEGRTLKAGGAWIFDNEIDSVTGAFENGDVVMVHDFDGYPMGRGFINMHSKIRIRMLTRNPDQEIDEEFFRERLRDAWEYRKKTVDTGSCRIVFGEADFLFGRARLPVPGSWDGQVQGKAALYAEGAPGRGRR